MHYGYYKNPNDIDYKIDIKIVTYLILNMDIKHSERPQLPEMLQRRCNQKSKRLRQGLCINNVTPFHSFFPPLFCC